MRELACFLCISLLLLVFVWFYSFAVRPSDIAFSSEGDAPATQPRALSLSFLRLSSIALTAVPFLALQLSSVFVQHLLKLTVKSVVPASKKNIGRKAKRQIASERSRQRIASEPTR
jgi:hypothetical protein